jgi:hypothetical protein
MIIGVREDFTILVKRRMYVKGGPEVLSRFQYIVTGSESGF